jgi:hypothetical protein
MKTNLDALYGKIIKKYTVTLTDDDEPTVYRAAIAVAVGMELYEEIKRMKDREELFDHTPAAIPKEQVVYTAPKDVVVPDEPDNVSRETFTPPQAKKGLLQDPHTGEWFKPKRRNQRFASRENQVAYNNDLFQQRRAGRKPTIEKLENNWKIAHNLLGSSDTVSVGKESLKTAGFDFEYVTRFAADNSTQYIGLYELVLVCLDNVVTIYLDGDQFKSVFESKGFML